jgi:choline dehydrogenase-like flavoprotein
VEDFNDLDQNAGVAPFPAILLRSGIGPADELTAIGVKPVLDLPGVGRNLHDQPCLEVWYEGSDELIERMEHHQARTGWRPDEQVIAKLSSTGCRQGSTCISTRSAAAARWQRA